MAKSTPALATAPPPMRIEIHEGGHVFGYQRRADDKWDVFINGHLLPSLSQQTDARDVLWQVAFSVLGPLAVEQAERAEQEKAS